MVVVKGMDFPKKSAKCQFRIFDYEGEYEDKCFSFYSCFVYISFKKV